MTQPAEDPLTGSFAEQLQASDQLCSTRQFSAGEVIFRTGDPGDGFYVVKTGSVQITAALGGSEPHLLATIGPGNFFGEMAVLDDAPRSATATAETDTQALFVTREVLLRILDRRPQLALLLVREFSRRMRSLNRKYLDDIIQSEQLAAVGKAARGIVHDFKNPLAVMLMAAELAGSDSANPAARLYAREQITRQVERMTDMLDELIDFTRPTDANALLAPVLFPEFMQPLADDLRQEIAPRGVTLVFATPPPGISVRIDPKRLPRLFFNLVNNAIEAMPGGGTVTLRFLAGEKELQVEVTDTGRGIAPELAGRLFQPFATHDKEHGTGLGLSICKKIVSDHGGRIWVQDAPGGGATFCFTLPLAGQPDPATPDS